VRSDLRVVALAFAADSPTLQSPVDERKRKAATPKLAAANAASKKCIVSEDEDNAPEVKPKKKPTAAPKPAAPVKPTAAPKPAAPVKPTAAAPKPAAPVKPTAAAPKPAAAPKKQAAPKARAPRATASKSKKHVVSDDEDQSDEDDGDSDEYDGDSDNEVSSHAHGSPSCRVPIPML
jgi:outer membrane biosynthesis protein TonB